ncbi:MAG TPA: GntR family transcriptional regulator [Stellaceae bacterium]|nr:GntR family transcriptional regulator [Stellaceae bacterium]
MDRFAGIAAIGVPKPETMADRVANVLREAIAKGTLKPGTVLRQDELAARFRFSRMPIRDALRQLEAEGIVSIHPTRGAFVAEMDRAEIRDIYAVRELLESEALRLSVPKLDKERLAEAKSILERLDLEADIGRWGALNRAFHLSLYGACGNNRLLALIEAQHKTADRYVRVILSNLDYRARSQAEHREMLDRCAAGDAKGAVTSLRKHLRDASRALVRSTMK